MEHPSCSVTKGTVKPVEVRLDIWHHALHCRSAAAEPVLGFYLVPNRGPCYKGPFVVNLLWYVISLLLRRILPTCTSAGDSVGIEREADAVSPNPTHFTCPLWAFPGLHPFCCQRRHGFVKTFSSLNPGNSYFHFCTTTPPRLNSAISPKTCALSVNSFEGNVVMSA